MTLFRALDIASSGMSVQRTRMNVAAMNVANKNTTRSEEGGPYKRRDVVLEATPVGGNFASRLGAAQSVGDPPLQGVRVAEVRASDDEAMMVYDPGHPDADGDGYVAFPAVSAMKEMVNMTSAARAYEAGTTVLRTVRQMAEQALRIGR